MADRTDHIAEARNWLDGAESARTSLAETTAFAATAQVHATLALVEQQRIANLIALSQGTFPNGQRYTDHIHRPIDDFAVAMNDDIREGLGL